MKKFCFFLSLILNIIFSISYFMPKNWMGNLYTHPTCISIISTITENPLYKKFFPSPPHPGHKDFILAVYQTMKDIHEIFEKHQIVYWTDGGTTLGVMRHKGLIPWDDDLDLIVPTGYDLRLQSLNSLLNKLGYTLQEVSFGYKILTKKYFTVTTKTGKTKMRVCCDIFLMGNNGKEHIFLKSSARHQWPHAFYKNAEIYPLKKRLFGKVEVFTVNDPIPYLNRQYGKSWSSLAYQGTHSQAISLKAFKPKEFKPALPLGPLEDRILKIR